MTPEDRLREVERGRDNLARIVREFRENRSVAFQIGDVTLFGSRENVAKANATLAHLKQKASRS